MTAARPAVERPALPPRINASARGVLVPRLIRWSFYMYMASLPLERLSSSVPIEVATLTGAVLIASAARSPLACFGRIPSAATGLVAVLCMLTIGYLEHGRSSGEVMIYLILFVELILLLWVGFNLMYDDRIALRGLLALILACTIVAI